VGGSYLNFCKIVTDVHILEHDQEKYIDRTLVGPVLRARIQTPPGVSVSVCAGCTLVPMVVHMGVSTPLATGALHMDHKHTSPWHPLYRGSGGVGTTRTMGVRGYVVGVGMGLLLGLGVGWGVGSSPVEGPSVEAASVQLLPPCPAEDSPGPCFWDAGSRGDGSGRSFTVDGFGVLTYWDTGETRLVG
jgi:hypothetical protein